MAECNKAYINGVQHKLHRKKDHDQVAPYEKPEDTDAE
jgi:hypothetical protein